MDHDEEQWVMMMWVTPGRVGLVGHVGVGWIMVE